MLVLVVPGRSVLHHGRPGPRALEEANSRVPFARTIHTRTAPHDAAQNGSASTSTTVVPINSLIAREVMSLGRVGWRV